MPEPEELQRIIDRACDLSEQTLGYPPDRRAVAESVMSWARVLWPLAEVLRHDR